MNGRRNFKENKLKKGETSKSLKNIAVSMKKYLPAMILSLIFIIAYVLISVIAPNILSDLTNTIATGLFKGHINMNKIAHYGYILLTLYIISALSSALSGIIITVVVQRYSYQLRKQIVKKINNIPLNYYDTRSLGDILSILTNDVDQISQSMQQSIGMFFSAVLMLVSAIVAMFVTSWQMALVALLTIPLMMILLMIILKLAGPQFIKRQKLLGNLNGVIEENYNGQNVIKLYNATDMMKCVFDEKNLELQKTMFKAEFFGGLMQPLMSFISYISYALVCITGGLLMYHGKGGITLGTITAFLVYINLFQSPLTQIAQSLNSLQNAAASGSRVFSFLESVDLDNEDDKEYYFAPKKEKELEGFVEFDNVSFSYDETREIIKNFSVKIKPGMKVAIVGPTGAGKTTIVNLLERFYEISSGTIKIDGIKTSDMKREELHDKFSMVLQDTWVFEGTLRENLVFNLENISDEMIWDAIRACHLTHFVKSLPNGLDYKIVDAASISQGQRQLITIARAMLKNSKMLILDEATSNVDTRTEEKIQEAMDRLTKGRTSFVIAHRLSTIKNSDIILVMKDGNIIEQGNHCKLMNEDGFYKSLYNSQFALEN